MSIHPLFITLFTRPERLVEHAGAYYDLASAEAGEVIARLRLRVIYLVVALVCLALGVLFSGVALLFLALYPVSQMHAPWVLAVVPAVPLLLAGLFLWLQHRQTLGHSFPLLREQLAIDRSLFRRFDSKESQS